MVIRTASGSAGPRMCPDLQLWRRRAARSVIGGGCQPARLRAGVGSQRAGSRGSSRPSAGAPGHGHGSADRQPVVSGRVVAPRMPSMPATMNSARFVGRDAAFVRLAPALEAASDGDATTVLLDGPGGVGVTRFVDELGPPGRRSRRGVRGRPRPRLPARLRRAVRADHPRPSAGVPGRRRRRARRASSGRRPRTSSGCSPRSSAGSRAAGACRSARPRRRSSAARAGSSRASSAWSAGWPSGVRSCSSSRISTTPMPAAGPSCRS